MHRRLAVAFGVALSATVLLATPSRADERSCRARAASKAAAAYQTVSKLHTSCAAALAAGKTCDQAKRDATLRTKLASARTGVQAGCPVDVAAGLGFASNGDLAVRVAGTAAGEGRQVTDSVFGRPAVPRSPAEVACAKRVTSQTAKAGKLLVKTILACGTTCTPASQAKVDAAFAKAATVIGRSCGAAELNALLGGNLAGHLSSIRAGAQRVADSLRPAPRPSASVVSPAPGTIVHPPSLPVNIDVAAIVAGVPHAGYVDSIEIAGVDAAFDSPSGQFRRTVVTANPHGTAFPIFLRARTSLGTVSTTATVNLDLGTLAPGVVITGPPSGTITPAASIAVSGTVIGNRAAADVLLVGGVPTAFDPATGAFSRSVPLGAASVQILEASVQSVSLGTNNRDSVVVLRGDAVPLASRVPNANFNRLNNSGFIAVRALLGSLTDLFNPATFADLDLQGGRVCEFSTAGAPTLNLFGAGPSRVQAEAGVQSFRMKVCDIDIGIEHCDLTVTASSVSATIQADLVGQLAANLTGTQITFSGLNANLSGGLFCEIGDLLIGFENAIRDGVNDAAQDALPAAVNDALGGINISGPIGSALNVIIDGSFTSIPEDSNGVTFVLDSNVIPLAPVADAPSITQTVAPVSVSPPVLDRFVPGTSTPYDLGFCLSDGFVNRALAAFMLQGQFSLSLDEVPLGGSTVPLTTALLSALLGDASYQTACPNCPVTLVLKPTAAPVSRAPLPGETAGVVLVIPNYRIEVVASNGGTPLPLLTATLVFELGLTLDVSGGAIAPVAGPPLVSNVRVTDNPVGANPAAFATGVAQFFPLAAQALGGLFGQVPLPEFQGLHLSGVASGYNVSCTAIT